MNITLKAAVLAILAMGCSQLYADIEIEVRLIEASPEIPVTTDLSAIDQMKGVDLLSAPRVSMKPGAKAEIRVIKEFAIEGQDNIPVGIELEITADQTPTGLSYIAKYKLTEFEGFAEPEGTRRPVFQTTTIPFNGSAQDNVPILIEVSSKIDTSRKRYIYLTIRNV